MILCIFLFQSEISFKGNIEDINVNNSISLLNIFLAGYTKYRNEYLYIPVKNFFELI